MCVCHLSEELLHQTVSPAVVQRPGFGRVTDICGVKHQRQNLHFVQTGETGQKEKESQADGGKLDSDGDSAACRAVYVCVPTNSHWWSSSDGPRGATLLTHFLLHFEIILSSLKETRAPE